MQHIAVSFRESTSIAVSLSRALSIPLTSINKTEFSIVVMVSRSLAITSTDLHLHDLLLDEALSLDFSMRFKSIICLIEGS